MVRNLLKNIILSHYKRTFQKEISMSDLCESIRGYRWAFVKMDVPYMPTDFPKSVPVGKDADIICLKDDFEMLRSAVRDWCVSVPDKYVTKTIEATYGCRTRISNVFGILLYQIDLSWATAGMNTCFFEDAIRTRREENGIYMLDDKYEYIYRMYSFSSDRNKSHHKEYLIKHMRDYDISLAKKYTDISIEDLLG